MNGSWHCPLLPAIQTVAKDAKAYQGYNYDKDFHSVIVPWRAVHINHYNYTEAMKSYAQLPPKQNSRLASLLIRIGLAIVFLYAAVDAFIEPAAWITYVPAFSNQFIDAKLALDLLSVFQIFLAAWLVIGKYLKISAVVAAAMLGGIMILNIPTLLITFRDIGLVFAAIALLFLDDK